MAKKKLSLKQYQKLAEQLVQRIHQEVPPFEDVSLKAKEERRRKALNDLEYLCRTYLPHHFDSPFEAGHYQICDALSTITNKVIQILGFRGVGKSTLTGVGYAMQCVLSQKTRYLPIISDTYDQAELLMLPLKVELEENPRIKADFGDMKGIEWSEDSIITRNGVKIEASSWRSFKRGRRYLQHRPKVIICDDLESLESVKNKRNIDKRDDALFGDIMNALDLKTEWQMVVVCNKLGRDDIATRLEANKAVHTVAIPAELPNKRAAHPKSFPKRILNTIAETIGPVKYAREYLLKIISKETDDFQEEWFVQLERPEKKYKYIVMANDPSVGATEGHDTKAWLVMGLTTDEKHVDVLHAWIRNTTINSMCKQGFELYKKFNPHKASIEGNGFQQLLKPIMQNMAKEYGYGFGFMSSISLMVNNANKNVRIMRLQTGIQNGFYRFVKGSDMQRLINQFLSFDSSETNNEDDGPDTMEMGNRLLRRLNGEIGTVDVEWY